jgi:hypothetical protein
MLLTKALQKSLPALYSQENTEDPIIRLHMFNPMGQGDWWVTEGSWEGEPTDGNPGEDFIMFGLCDLGFPELGYVSLNEMKSVHLPFGMGIERDLHWVPVPLSTIQEKVSCG